MDTLEVLVVRPGLDEQDPEISVFRKAAGDDAACRAATADYL